MNTCYSDNLRKQIVKSNPQVQQIFDQMDLELSKIENPKKAESVMITIPVVFFVVHDNQPNGVGSNISDLQVDSQLIALNTYFNDYGLNFCYATKAGATNISSINHINNTTLANHTTSNQTALENAGITATNFQVDKTKYLRIYIVKSINGASSGILGYATFPNSSDFDGIVMKYNAVGDTASFPGGTYIPNYNQGKVLVHEIGHYLGLYHTFQESCAGTDSSTCNLQGDRVCDTPPVNAPNFGCVLGTDSCIEDDNLPDDINNFMDYGDNVCQQWFSEGQKNRMLNLLTVFRSSLISPDNIIFTATCGSSSLISASFTPSSYQTCTGSSVSFTPLSTGTGITYSWDFGDPASGVNNTSTAQNPTHIFSSAINSPYTVTLTVDNGTDSYTAVNQIFASDCTPVLSTQGNWRFGNSASGNGNSLDFSSGIPIMTSVNDTERTEATSVISSATGQLLFKSNGIDVSNSNFSFYNGSLFGSKSAHRGTLIVKNPNPSFPNQYYLFTKNGIEQTLRSGLRYSLVDAISPTNVSINPVNLNLAATVPAANGYIITPNGGIEGGEGITVISSQFGYWIITTGKKATGYFFMVFRLDPTGLSFVSETPTIANAAHSGLNSLEVSPNGDRILLILDGSTNTIPNSGTYLYDFDKFSGQVISNPINLEVNSYGASFSPNSNLLYLNTNKSYQVNLQDLNQNATRKVFYNTNIFSYGDIQKGPDNKLYYIYPYETTRSLYVIHNPNELITTENPNACNFSKNGPSINTLIPHSAIGLPNMVNSEKETAFETEEISSYPSSCYTRRFFPDSYGDSFNWDFGDPASGANNTFTGTLVTHTFSGNGTFIVTLRSATNVLIAQTTIVIGILPVTILGSSTACTSENNTTNNSVAMLDGQTVLWSITGGAGVISGLNNQADVTINWTTLPGTVSLTITNGSGCTSTITRTIIDECLSCDCLNSLGYRERPQLDNTFLIDIINNGGSMCSSLSIRNTWRIGNGTPFTTLGFGTIGYTAGGSQPFTVTTEALDAYGNVICSRTSSGGGIITSEMKMKQKNNEIKDLHEISYSITPNPSSGLIMIKIGNFNGKIDLDIIDLNGRIVYSLKNTTFNLEKTINLRDLQSGIYILKLNGNNLSFTEKIILN
ncbi:T9SS type A sorting domain-containing protein [Flavobacterium psychrophilum]|nr:T9SS type A sorting domain-containing protein [Flavobacterium psychrophilum]